MDRSAAAHATSVSITTSSTSNTAYLILLAIMIAFESARHPMKRGLALFAVLVATALVPLTAHAEQAATMEILRPSSRPFSAMFSLAPALDIANTASQLKLAQALQMHLNGSGDGLALGGEVQESVGNGEFTFQLGPKAWYDFAIVPDLGIYLAPSAMIGLSFSTMYSSVAAFNMQYGIEAKMVFEDRALLFFRPFTLDIGVGNQTFVRYDIMFGGGVTF
jgi:hypothetical protein